MGNVVGWSRAPRLGSSTFPQGLCRIWVAGPAPQRAASLPSQPGALWSQGDRGSAGLEPGLWCGGRGRWEMLGQPRPGGVTGLARVVCFSVERHYYFSCLLWSLMMTANGLCPTALGKSLQIWGGLVVPCRASSPFSARSGGAAASPAVCAWMGCLHCPLPQFPCLESSVEGTFPSLAGAGRHKQELCVPTVGRGLLWHRAGCGSHPAQALCPWGDGVASMGACRCGSGLTRDPALPRQRGGGAGIPRGPRTSPPAAAHPTTWGN